MMFSLPKVRTEIYSTGSQRRLDQSALITMDTLLAVSKSLGSALSMKISVIIFDLSIYLLQSAVSLKKKTLI